MGSDGMPPPDAPKCDAGDMDRPVALITGAARGIGAATLGRLAADGWQVMAVDSCRDDPAIVYRLGTEAELAAVVESAGEYVISAVADVRDQAALDAAVATALDRFGRLDAVVAAAGVVAGGGPLWELDDPIWRAVLDIDLTGVFHTIRATVPAILATSSPGRGRVVVLASAAGSLGLHHMAAYAAAKHGVVGLARSLAADLAGTGVTANVVSPGSTRTSMLDASADVYGFDDPERFVVHQEPLGRLIEPSEVAATIGWLCSAEASAITGAVVAVDGGMTATN